MLTGWAGLMGLLVHAQVGQNLVVNPGFENITKKVVTWDQLSHAPDWSNANLGTADLFSPDGTAKNVGIPTNFLGTAAPHEGNHYAGFIAYNQENAHWVARKRGPVNESKDLWDKYAEYVQAPLSAALEAGKLYDVSFWVHLASSSDRAVSGLGALLTKEQVKHANNRFLDEKPQIHEGQVLQNSGKWVQVRGSMIAAGGERFITVGAFPAAGMRKVDIISGPDNQHAYYYVDLVSVELVPDTDGDGLVDREDACPKEAGPKALKGCPDRDGDGLADKEDACPDKAGPIADKGCPDTDGDRIADNVDRCPMVAGVPALQGCPEPKPIVKTLFERAMYGIQFETGKATIKKKSYPILDEVVAAMKENPDYLLDIAGHTDNVGDDNFNLDLSKQRAAAVEKYLEDKGIEHARIMSEGLGETKPIADNATKQGRAKNRRVEFTVKYWR